MISSQRVSFCHEPHIATFRKGVDVGDSTLGRAAGLGAFATQFFAKNDLVTEYAGDVVSENEARDGRPQTHLVRFDNMRIDGIKQPEVGLGLGSFCNDPQDDRRNVRFWTVNRLLTRIFVKATRDIEAGEELFIKYDGRATEVAMGQACLAARSGGERVRAPGRACNRGQDTEAQARSVI